MRVCSLCGAKDYPQILPDQCTCGSHGDHATGCAAIQHFVVKDIRRHEGPITQPMKRKGWSELGNFQGKQAVQRLLCRTCVRKQEEVYDIEEYKKRCGREAEQGTDLNMYEILCN